MTINVANVDVTVDTFSVLVTRVNQMADAFTNHTVTLDSSAFGNNSSGNGFVSGVFGANTLIAGTSLGGGSVNQSANLNVISNTSFQSNVTFSNIVNFNSNVNINDIITINATANLANTLTVTGNTLLSNTLIVIGNVSFSNTLTVTGNSTFTNSVIISGSATINNLTVTGNTNLDTGTLFIDSVNDRIGIGNTTPNAKLQVSGTANVSGNVSLSENLIVTGNSSFTGRVSVTSNVVFSNTLTVTGNVSFSNTLTIGYQNYITVNSASFDIVPALQVVGFGASPSAIIAMRYSNNANSSRIFLSKSRSEVPGQFGNVAFRDYLGRVVFAGDTNTTIREGASIDGRVLGTVSNTNIPTGIVFETSDTGLLTERMVIDPSGNVGIGSFTDTTLPNAKLQVSGTANVSGNVSLAENLTVTGNSNLTGNIILTGNAALSNTLVVTGNTRLANTLTVTGNATFANVVIINGSATINNLTVTGNTNLDTGTLFIDATNDRIGIGNTTPDAKLTVTGTANVSGNVSLAENLIVIGNSSFTGNVILTGNAALSNTLVVTGNTRLANTLTVTGNTRLANTLVVTGNVSLSNTLTVTGNTTLSGPVTLSINNSEPALKVTQSGSGHTLYIEDSTSPDATPTVITTTGAIVSGANLAPSSPLNARISSINDTGSGYLVANYANLSNQPARISFYKTLSVNTDISNVYSPVLNNYALGSLFFYGDDGGQPIEAARITVLTNGIPGPNSMPTALHFYTTNDGSNSALAAGPKLSIMANGNVGVGAGTPTEKLYVNGNLRVTGNSNISGELYVSSNTNIDGGTFSVDTVLNTVGVGTATPNTKLSVSGPIALYPPTKVITAAYTVTTNDSSLIIDTIANCNLVMPAAATYPGRILYIKNIAARSVNSTSANIKPIDSNTSANSILTNTAGKFAMLQSDGADWVIMMSN